MKIIFTHLKPDIWQYKVASNLKRKGLKTISISLLSFNKDLFKEAFDEIICLDLEDLKPGTLFNDFFKNPLHFINFFYKLITIKADTSICQGAPHYLSAFFIWLFKGRFPRIYFPYDMNFSRYKNPKTEIPPRDIFGERYSFINCNGFIYKGMDEELDLIPPEWKIKNKLHLNFPCYPLKEWFANTNPKDKISCKDKQIHIVYTGSIMDPGFYTSMTEDFSNIISQKIHLHIYCAFSQINNRQIEEITKKDEQLEKYFHIHQPVSPEILPKEISRYDFGLHWTGLSEEAKEGAVKFATGNKIASYLEAGIPLIAKNENLITKILIKKNNLGILINDFNNLQKTLRKFRISFFVKNVLEFREEYSVEKNIGKLIEFVRGLNN